MTVKEIVPTLNREVLYNGIEYLLTGSIVRRNVRTGELWYQAEIKDMLARSVCYVNLDDLTIKENQ